LKKKEKILMIFLKLTVTAHLNVKVGFVLKTCQSLEQVEAKKLFTFVTDAPAE
jgi:hypothetical protein